MTEIKISNIRLGGLRLSYKLLYLIICFLAFWILVLIIGEYFYKETLLSVIDNDNQMIRDIGLILLILILPTCIILALVILAYSDYRHFKLVCRRFNLTPDVPLHPAMILAPPTLLLAKYSPGIGEYKGFKLLYHPPTGEGLPWMMTLVLGKETPDLVISSRKSSIPLFFKSKSEVKVVDPEFDDKLIVISKDPNFALKILDPDIRRKILKLKNPKITIKKIDYGNSIIYSGSYNHEDLDYIEKVLETLGDIADKIRDMD